VRLVTNRLVNRCIVGHRDVAEQSPPSKFQHSSESLTVHFIDAGRYFMSGTIIEFRRYRNLNSHRRGARTPLPYRPNRRTRLGQQTAQIEVLLKELEEIGHRPRTWRRPATFWRRPQGTQATFWMNLIPSPRSISRFSSACTGVARMNGRGPESAPWVGLLPLVVVLTAFITTVVTEAMYFVCHLWRCLFDGSALSFSWTEPLPVAGLSTVSVLLVAILAARLMRRASEDALDAHDCLPAWEVARLMARRP
jgi:hypothetical protein